MPHGLIEMNVFLRQLVTEWRKLNLPTRDAAVLVAVSGGADSVALLIALAELRKRKKIENDIVVAHYDHNVRPGSEEDAKFVANLSKELNLDYIEDVAPDGVRDQTNANLEQTLRHLRYKFLFASSEAKECEVVLVAHTVNDQAETFLMNLIRGSGPDGLSAMPVVADFRSIFPELFKNDKQPAVVQVAEWNPKLIRPLLSWAKRDDTEEYVRSQGIEFREDETNNDRRLLRVKVRKELIPWLRKVNPSIVNTLARSADMISSVLRLAEGNNAADLGRTKVKLGDFQGQTPELQRHMIREWLKLGRGNLRKISSKHIFAVERLINSKKSGRMVELPDGDRIIKAKGALVFRKAEVEK